MDLRMSLMGAAGIIVGISILFVAIYALVTWMIPDRDDNA